MSVSRFVELAGFPPDWREEHLQEYLAQRLREMGYTVYLEVKCGRNCGRADIVADPTDPNHPGDIVEVKSFLPRDEMFQAKGQVESYQDVIPSRIPGQKRRATVMGFAPIKPEAYRSALVAKALIQQGGNVDVIFVNEDPEFLPNVSFYVKSHSHNQSTTSAVIARVLSWLFLRIFKPRRKKRLLRFQDAAAIILGISLVAGYCVWFSTQPQPNKIENIAPYKR